jgi:ABC-type transport system substrate-binding protein
LAPLTTRHRHQRPLTHCQRETQNITEARKLVRQAGDTGKTITIGTTSQMPVIAGVTAAGGLENYDNFSSSKIAALVEQARGTANPDQRAALVAEAEKLTVQQLPWIPDVQPDTVLVLGRGLTGAISSSAYLFSPWADRLGGTG